MQWNFLKVGCDHGLIFTLLRFIFYGHLYFFVYFRNIINTKIESGSASSTMSNRDEHHSETNSPPPSSTTMTFFTALSTPIDWKRIFIKLGLMSLIVLITIFMESMFPAKFTFLDFYINKFNTFMTFFICLGPFVFGIDSLYLKLRKNVVSNCISRVRNWFR